MYNGNKFIRTLRLFLFFLLYSFSLLAQSAQKQDPGKKLLIFMDGKEVTDLEMKNLNPNDVANITVLKDKSSRAYGEKGKNGVLLIETIVYRRQNFQKYLSSKSPAYSKILSQNKSDAGFKYILNGQVLKKSAETDLATITDSTFISLDVIDSVVLSKSYGVSSQLWGVVIKTSAGSKTSSVIANVPKSKFEPQLLILAPAVTTFVPSATQEIDKIDKQLNGMTVPQDSGTPGEENVRLMRQSAIDFSKHLNFFNQASVFAQSYLAYRFFEHFPNTLILVKDLKVKGDLESVAAVAQEQHMPYVLNFSSMYLDGEKGRFIMHAKVQLYEAESNSFLVDQEYTGDQLNQGFEFSCDGSINCTVNNMLAKALPDVISKIAENNKTLQGERRLNETRTAVIAADIFPKALDAAVINAAIPASDSTINKSDLYQVVYNGDKSKFVGFFYLKVDKKKLKDLSAGLGDVNVKIISDKSKKDKDFLDIPQNKVYIVTGILDKGIWYYHKDMVTYLEAENEKEAKLKYLNNLQQWGYFAEHTAGATPDFWETGFFEKVADKRKSPEWEKYKNMWETEEREDRDYIGMYKIIADSLKNEKAKAAHK